MSEVDHGLSQQSSDTGAASTTSGTGNTAATAPRKKGKQSKA